jgi:PAS domain S-box-containing protein
MTNRNSFVDVHPHQLDYRLLVEECLAGIYLIQDERFLYVNPALAELFGYSAEEIVSDRTVQDLVAPGDRGRVMENLRQRTRGEIDTLHYCFRGLRANGSIFDVEVRGRRTQSRGAPAVIGTLLDVTDRSRERDRLRFLARAAELLDSSLDYETTLESLARLMIPFFADLCFIDILEGQELRRLAAGPWPGEGTGFNIYSALEGDDQQDGATELVLREGTGILLVTVPPEMALRIASRLPGCPTDGSLEIRSLIVVPLIAREEIMGAMTLATTVSGRVYDRQDLEFAREVARSAALAVDNARLYHDAQEAIQRRQEVLAVVSHDLRNPLNVIVMSAALALELERRRQGPLEAVHNAAKEMERLINDLLDLSAIEAGGLSVNPVSQRIVPLVEQCVAMLSPTAERRSVQIHCRIDEPDLHAAIDAGRFPQALGNLIGNAIKFTPEGGEVVVRVRRDGDRAIISVRDSGPGIPPEQLEHVFDRFWQLEKGQDGGAGLGLAIVRGIAEAHGGSVGVESCPGEGSTFWVSVPAS